MTRRNARLNSFGKTVT